MNSFTFQTTKTIFNEPGIAGRLGNVIQDLDLQRLLLVTDPGIIQTGIAKRVSDGLTASELEVFVFDKVAADPPELMILDAVNLARKSRVDGVIGLGGGSSLDTAKLVAFLVHSKQELNEIYGVGMAKGTRLPLVLIPTTSGTGSEVTPISIVTTGDNQKMGVVSPLLLPDMAILDAELTLGLPSHITAATGVDAMVHAIEAFTTKIRKNPISDILALKALELLANHIQQAVTNGSNLEARSGMLLGSLLAGQAFANAPVAAVHALAYPVGGHFHVPHGLSNSLMLPHVMRYNSTVIADQYAELADIVLPHPEKGDAGEKSKRMIDWLETLILELGLKTRLSQVGVKEKDLTLLATDAIKQERLLINNPREITFEDALAIYQAAF